MNELQKIEIALVQYVSSEHDAAFLDAAIEALYNLQTDEEKRAGKSIHHNGRGFDAGDAVRFHDKKHPLTHKEKVDIVIKYTKQLATLIESGELDAPAAFYTSPTKREKCAFKPMDFTKDDKPVKPLRVKPHNVNDDTFIVNDDTIVFEDGTHVGKLPKRRPKRRRRRAIVESSEEEESESEVESESDEPVVRRTSARIAATKNRHKLAADSEASETSEEEEEEEDEPIDNPSGTLVTIHGIVKNGRLVLPSASFVETILTIRDEVIAYATEMKRPYWSPSDVLQRASPLLRVFAIEMTMDDMDGILYTHASPCALTKETRGTFRIFAETSWVTAEIVSCVVYKYGLYHMTLLNAEGMTWTTESTMIYSVNV